MEENNYLCTKNQSSAMIDIKKKLELNNSNISDMAEKLGLQQPSLSRTINNGNVTIKMIGQMAEKCNKTSEEFLGCAVPKEIKMTFNGQEYTYILKK